MPGIISALTYGAISLLILFVGQEQWDDWTYEDRVEACVEQLHSVLPSDSPPSIIQQAEINCRKTLK